MTIESKLIIGRRDGSRFIATKSFTDREIPKEAFEKQVKKILDEKSNGERCSHALVFYGIGGVGKSSLQKELKKHITLLYNNIIYTSVDMANVPNQNTARMLLEMSKVFSDKNINMPHFSIAYAIYFQKSNRDLLFNSNKKKIINENFGFVADVLGLIDGLGIFGIIPDMVNKIYDVAVSKLRLDKSLKEDLKSLELKDIVEIENLLPEFWAYDIIKFLELNKEKLVVVFIDTYEALWKSGKNEFTKFSRDQVIRNLISKLPGVLFVISGREYIEWSDIDSEWSNILEQHQLERLDEIYAEKFLQGCNVIEPEIREQMIKVSLGHPYYLDLLVDTYVEMRNSQIVPIKELIAPTNREILENFFKYLEVNEIEVIKILSVTRYYDFPLFRYLLLELPTGYPVTKFDDFNKFSFVNQLTERNYHLHELMQKEVLNYISDELYQTINLTIIKYYNLQITQDITYETLKSAIKECIYHYNYILEPQDYQETIMNLYYNYFRKFQNRGESLYLYEVLNEVYKRLNNSMNAELVEIYSDMVMLNGNFKDAVVLLDVYLESYDINQIVQDELLLHLYVKKAKHQMTYESIDNTLTLLDTIKNFIKEDEYPRPFTELIYTRANMLLINNSLEKAKENLDQVMDIAEKNNYYDMQCRALRKIADYHLYKKEERKADEACTKGIAIAQNYGYERYANYLQCTKAEICRRLKLFAQARNIYTQCCESFQSLGVAPWIAHSNLGLAQIELEKGNYPSVLEILEKCMNIYKQTNHAWGKITTMITQLQCKYLSGKEIKANDFCEIKQECVKLGYSMVLSQVEALENNQVMMSNLFFL